MLYVFQMDTGQMLTFDMALLMDTVSRLQVEIAKTTGISVEKQILILSGGQSLKADQKVITYGAGADTNPVFLFSKLAIESQEPPLIRSFGTQKDALIQLKERICDAMKLRPAFETVTVRTKLAVQIRDGANKILTYCNNEFKEQHLQYQGWGAVVANLEEIAQALQRTGTKFCKTFQSFLPNRENNFAMLQSLSESFELLGRIPLLDSLKEGAEEECEAEVKNSQREKSIIASFHPIPTTLLDWISSQAQGQGLESLQQKCFEDITVFNDGMFESYDTQVTELLDMVSSDKHQMKELVGIERRLSELEKRLNEAKKIAKSQNDMAQGFLKHQTQLSSLDDAIGILPDLCKSHQQQLSQMLEGQQRIVALQNNFRNSKQEMSTNIHQRLGWVMHIETQIAKLDSELIFHLKTLRILECNLDLLGQVKASPQVYAEIVVETTQRKKFSSKFTQWAEILVEDSNQLYKSESERRKQFSKRLGEHFLLHSLFKGFEDMPPNFATKVPRLFDASLPDITEDDISKLKSSVPELGESLSAGEHLTQFPLEQLSKQTRGSFDEKNSYDLQGDPSASACQLSQSNKPCVITATEAPPTLFTLPELQESRATEYHPALSSLTDTMRELLSCPEVKESASAAVVDSDGDKNNEKTSDSQTVTKETQTQTSPSVEQRECSKCLKNVSETSERSESSQSVRQPVAGKVTSNTDSSSPLSSNEFATADFYFEDSMPSPMTESEKKDKEAKGESSTTSSKDGGTNANNNVVATLKDQLREKDAALEELRSLVTERETEISKLQKQVNVRESRSDESESITLVASNSLLAASSCELLDGKDGHSSPDFVHMVRVQGSSDSSSSLALHDSASLESSIRVQNRVRDLEEKLEKLTDDLERSKDSLLKAEQCLYSVQEQEQASVEDKNRLIGKLQEEVSGKNVNLEELGESLKGKEKRIVDLEKDAAENRQRVEKLEDENAKANKTLQLVKDRLNEFAAKVKENVPTLRRDLAEIRSSVVENTSQFDYATSAALDLFLKEREKVALEKEDMEQSLAKIQHELTLEVKALKSANGDLSSEVQRKEEHFAKKYAEQRYDFDSALRDMETKHALELEIELDKCKSETRESLEETERNYEVLTTMKDRLMKEMEEMKAQCTKTVKDAESLHESSLLEMEKSHKQKTKELQRRFDQMLEERKKEEEHLKMDLSAFERGAKERDGEWQEERSRLVSDHEEALGDLRERMESQRKDVDDLLETKQLDHAMKLTALKSEFDAEKESLLAQVRRFTELSMINSETQTGLGLLSEVISLTSSASDGSEEMNALRTPTSSNEEKEECGVGESASRKTQQQLEELTSHLDTAQETIASLNEQMKALGLENKNLKDEISDIKVQESSLSKLASMSGHDSGMSRQEKQMQMSASGASFILMDKEISMDHRLVEEMKMKEHKISQLERSLMEMSVTSSEKSLGLPSDKVSIKGCDKGDLVLLCLDERHDQYVVFTVGTNLHFLHSDSLEGLGIRQESEPTRRKSWILAEVVDKEYCLAKKPNNRFRVPQGTCFYRVKCQPWKCEFEVPKQDPSRKAAKKEPSETPSKAKK